MNTIEDDFATVRDAIRGRHERGHVHAAISRIEADRARLVAALEGTLAALAHVVEQIPNDERIADWRLDIAEAAEQAGRAALAGEPS